MATGDSNDILNRVKMLIPHRWFAWGAPLRDAILGGLSDSMAWCYSWIIYTKQQSRIATSTGPFLDLISYDFLGRHLFRKGQTDDQYRARILAVILQERVTRAGMVKAINWLTGGNPKIFEPWNTNDAGAWTGPGPSTYTFKAPNFAWSNTAGSPGVGGWGSTDLPEQAFMTVTRLIYSGIPNVAGLSGTANKGGLGAWVGGGGPPFSNVGHSIEWYGLNLQQVGITNDMIYDTINTTRPTGSIAWTRIQ